MTLAEFDLNSLREKILAAYNSDDPIFQKFREYARQLATNIKPLRTYSVNAVSFVGSDGGDNRLTFNPATIELIRVADSRGVQCALDVIASTADATELNSRGVAGNKEAVPPLERLCNDLGVSVTGLSYLLGGLGKAGKSTGAMRCYRDIVEWAVLYDLICNPSLQWGGDTILVREGLLRTKSFKRSLFPKIDQNIRDGVARHKSKNVQLSLVGVAKQSAVLGRLAVALELEGVFHRNYPCYVQVPREIEADCYNYDLTWLDTYESLQAAGAGEKEDGDFNVQQLYQSMGQMFLVKFGDRPLDPVWPVDIASWQIDSTERILGQLTLDAQQGFPIPDFPMCIQRAHEYAKLTGLEIRVLQDALMQGISAKLSPVQAERLLRFDYLGRSLAALRYKVG
jgi:hypothetical protein